MSLEGLSICIPVYNYEAKPLVEALSKQIQFLGHQVEIIIFDDNSAIEYCKLNRVVNTFGFVHYVELLHNVGRAAIRNEMAKVARFSYLLFIDVDSLPVSEDYIYKYWQAKEQASVLVGGTAYFPQMPESNHSLRWEYGKRREVKIALERSKMPYKSIALNNVMVKKEVFLQHPLNEKLQAYGHEDTLWGEHLEKQEISLKHIDNEVFHLGLEDNQRFLEKSIEASLQLKKIVQNQWGGESTRLFQFSKSLQGKFILALLKLIPESFLKNRVINNQSLKALDLLKLKHFAQ